jgi:hypothetical protein
MRAADYMGDAPGEVVKMIGSVMFAKGDKVKLKLGQRRSDVTDMLMDGMIATIEVIYTDYDDQVHIAVTMDDDPGQDLLRDMGIYRYFSPDELELIPKKED